MRFLRITTVYPIYLKKWMRAHSHLHFQRESFTELQKIFYEDSFGGSDFLTRALKPKGYEVWEVTSNHPWLQQAWARENGVKGNQKEWICSITEQQVKKFRPSILFVDDYSTFSAEWIRTLRKECRSIQLVLGWCGAPYSHFEVFREYDLVLSCIPELVDSFRQKGCRAEHFNHAFDPIVLERMKSVEAASSHPWIPFSFVGQVVKAKDYHAEREMALQRLAQEFPIQIFSPAGDLSLKDRATVLAKQAAYRFAQGWKRSGLPHSFFKEVPILKKAFSWTSCPSSIDLPELRKYLKPSVFGLEMFQTLKNSQLTFNQHIDISRNSASNMRLFEATGVGTCLVTDWKTNLHTLFDPDSEVVSYRSIEECIEKVRWLFRHPQESKKIAEAGQKKTLSEHSFEKRAETLDRLIQKYLKSL